MDLQSLLLYFLTAYMVGALPAGYVAARIKCGVDIFKPGEKQTVRIGDVFKILGIPLGLLVTLFDFLKGVLVAGPLVTSFLGEYSCDWRWVSIGSVLVVIGHVNSAFLGFRGGRGLATIFGVMFVLLPVPAAISCLLWAVLSFWGLSTQPGALSTACAMPLISALWVYFISIERAHYLYVAVFLSLLTLWEHRKRLIGYLGYWGKTE